MNFFASRFLAQTIGGPRASATIHGPSFTPGFPPEPAPRPAGSRCSLPLAGGNHPGPGTDASTDPRRRPRRARLAAAVRGALLGGTAPAQEPTPRRPLSGHRREDYSVAFSPGRRTLASAEAYLSAALKPGVVFLWDISTGGLRRA